MHNTPDTMLPTTILFGDNVGYNILISMSPKLLVVDF